MKGPDCGVATNKAIHTSSETRDWLHAKCPGAMYDEAGDFHWCDCPCHHTLVRDEAVARLQSLPVVPVTVPVAEPSAADRNRSVPVNVPSVGTRVCGCGCGAQVGPKARFRPGHDAKLKSRLVALARHGDSHQALLAREQLEALGWDHFI